MDTKEKTRITEEQCEQLYKEYNTPANVIEHCKAVSQIAVKIAQEINKAGYNLDIDLIKGAGLAHDVARVWENHGEVCAQILREKGFDDEAAIVEVHMHHDFSDFDHLNETDLVCLGDRLVKENQYVGLDERIDYIIHKAGDRPERTKKILEKKEETRELMESIEKVIGQSIDNLCMKG